MRVIVKSDIDGVARRDWVAGMAWNEKSRDFGYEIQKALEKLKTSGELKTIFQNYGVTYVEPPFIDKRD